MGEHHEITGPARGEPLHAGQAGACVRVPLEAAPSPRWARALGAALATGLTGHRAGGHLHLDNVVQGAEIVLEGVELTEAELLGPVLQEAIDVANRSCESEPDPGPLNMDPAEAERVARAVTSGVKR